MKYLRFVENLIIYVATTFPSLLTRLLKDGSQYLDLRLYLNEGDQALDIGHLDVEYDMLKE